MQVQILSRAVVEKGQKPVENLVFDSFAFRDSRTHHSTDSDTFFPFAGGVVSEVPFLALVSSRKRPATGSCDRMAHDGSTYGRRLG